MADRSAYCDFRYLILSLKLTAWKPAWYIFLLFLVFTIFSYHVVIPWLDGGLSIWATLFLVLGFLAINFNRNELAGISLAMSAIQPQMVILVLVFTLIWAASREKKITNLLVFYYIDILIHHWIIPGPRLDNSISPVIV